MGPRRAFVLCTPEAHPGFSEWVFRFSQGGYNLINLPIFFFPEIPHENEIILTQSGNPHLDVTRKCVFWDFRPSKIQTSLLSNSFYGKIWKINHKLSSNTNLISFADRFMALALNLSVASYHGCQNLDTCHISIQFKLNINVEEKIYN